MMDIHKEVITFFLIFFRILSIFFLVPLFASRQISIIFKGGFSLVFAYLIYDAPDIEWTVPTHSSPFVILFREFLLGFTITLVIRIMFAAVHMAGELVSLQSGFSYARFMDPYTMEQTSFFVRFNYFLAILVFFAIDGHYVLIEAIHKSFIVIPPGGFLFTKPLFDYVLTVSQVIFSTSLKIGAPIVVTLFFIEISLGIASRLIPYMNVFIEGIPIKILATLCIFSISLNFIVPVISNVFKTMESGIIHIIKVAG